MQSPDMWLHACTNILKNCRTAHQDPEEEEGVDPEEKKKEIERLDPYEPLLKPITLDEQVSLTDKVKTQAWSIKLMGDKDEYANEKDPKVSISNGVVVVRSLLWPGAYSFYCGGRVIQVYLGNGHKFTQQSSFYPVCPPVVMSDPVEDPDQPEPQGEPPKEEVPEDGQGSNAN